MKTKNMIAAAAGIILLVGATAGASVYVMDNMQGEKPSTVSSTSGKETVTFNQPRPAPLPECDDDNIVGKVVGGTAGGLVGSQIGSGSGNTAATIGGAIGGTLLGEEYIPTKNVTCR
jgi:outer membrane lipoprotein SlyB